MNCNVPTDICFSFTGFQYAAAPPTCIAMAGGSPFLKAWASASSSDPQPSKGPAGGRIGATLSDPLAQCDVYIRKATQGATGLENTHPFMRELWGRYWIFAHNGNLIDYQPEFDGSFLPVGQTDSERAFCHLLQRLRQRFAHTQPAATELQAALKHLRQKPGASAASIFSLSNGDRLFAHRSTELHYLIRQAPFSVAHLKDEDVSIDFNAVTTPPRTVSP